MDTAGTSVKAQAYWVEEPGVGEIRPVDVSRPGPDDVLVRTLFSGVSRGSESLVYSGGVPESQYDVMRAPFQEGDFPGPVKYGYLNVGVVEEGPDELGGRTVFCLYPHQTAYVVSADSVYVVPDEVPAERAVLAGTVETAVNALWDAAPRLGDRAAVVGAGMVGCSVARLLTRIAGVDVDVFDVDPDRADTVAAIGAGFRLADPDWDRSERRYDVVVHTSGTSTGLQLCLGLLLPDSAVTELSWYGDTDIHLSLGGDFHSSRLGIRASQVGTVAPARREHRTARQRMDLALNLLADPAFDALLSTRTDFHRLPGLMPQLAAGSVPGACHVITYDGS